jgi:membrane-bound lytic murein transglycosylase A
MTRRDSKQGRHKGVRLGRIPLFAALLVGLASCIPRTTAPTPVPGVPDNALSAGVTAGPKLPALDPETALRAERAFRITCPALLRREDSSGLTRKEDWQPVCAEAAALPAGDASAAQRFFRKRFELVQVGDGAAFATGYYEPQIAGSRTHVPGYDVPVYARPADLVETDAATAAAAGTPRRGRMENGVLVPYYERAEIEDGALANRGIEIAWAADPVDFFFLQIQGSGRLLLPDGSVMRIGYAGQNGRDYVGIGRLMRDRGLLEPGHATMQDIKAWLRGHPDEGKALMREDKSYIFFKELTGPGPLGALNLPVTERATVAADPKFVPLGAPVLLQLDPGEASGLWVAQDTGGAIRGRNRFDTFWGAGDEAARIAGGLQARGKAWLLVPKGSLKRLHATARR